MKKTVLSLIFILLSISAFSEIKYKIVEPVTFKNINTSSWDKNYVAGTGIIEVYTTDLEGDLGKLISVEFPEKTLITNRKKWVPLEKIIMEKGDKEFIVQYERKQVKIYAFLDRKKLDKGEEAAVIEGEYTGIIPLVISEYSRLQ